MDVMADSDGPGEYLMSNPGKLCMPTANGYKESRRVGSSSSAKDELSDLYIGIFILTCSVYLVSHVVAIPCSSKTEYLSRR